MIFLLLIPLIASYVLSSLVYKWNRQSPLVTIFSFAFFGTIITAVMFALSFAWTKTQFDNLSWDVWLLILARAAITILQIFLWVKGIKYVPVSIADPFSLNNMLFLLGFSWVIFGDALPWWSILLVVIIYVTCFIMGILQHKQEGTTGNAKNYAKGLAWIFLWTVAATGGTLLTRYIAEDINIFTMAFIKSAFVLALCLLLIIVCRQSIVKIFKTVIGDKVQYGIGFFDNINIYFYIPLALVMNLGVLDAITVTATIIVILIGVVFMKEKLRWYIYPFMIAAIACSVALAVLSG